MLMYESKTPLYSRGTALPLPVVPHTPQGSLSLPLSFAPEGRCCACSGDALPSSPPHPSGSRCCEISMWLRCADTLPRLPTAAARFRSRVLFAPLQNSSPTYFCFFHRRRINEHTHSERACFRKEKKTCLCPPEHMQPLTQSFHQSTHLLTCLLHQFC